MSNAAGVAAPTERLPVGQALALGALHGPAELLPISSSGHIALVPWLLGWEYDRLDAELRKSFEVALHAGTAAALLITLRDEVGDALGGLDLRRLLLIALSFAPPAVVGYTLERPIESRLGTPPTIAVGLIAGSLVMAAADRGRRSATTRRRARPTRSGSASPRRSRWFRASRGTVRHSPPRAFAASPARTRTASRATSRCP